MPDYHSRLVQQLSELGLDPTRSVTPEQLQALLAKVSAYYVHAEHEGDTLMTVLDTLSDTTCHVDQHGILRGINDRGMDFFRLEPRQMLERPLFETVQVEDGAGRRLTTEDLQSDRRIEHGLVVRHDGTRIAASISISRIAEGRRNEGAVVLLRDIEDLLEREEDLQRARVEALVARKAERAKGLFLANMSHELRTPLNAIIGYSEILCEDAELHGRTEQITDLRRIRVAGRHLNHLIGGILDLAKIEAGRMELYFEPCDVEVLAREALDTVRQSAGALELGLEVEDGLPAIRADATRLRQCLYNLLSNAVKFTSEGSITVRVATDGEEVRIAIADTGIGIAPDVIDKLFSEFGQGDAATTRKFGGTGLGLALSRRLCRLMGGDIEVQTAVGVGSTFTIILPVHGEARAALHGAPIQGATVLVIDDDLAVRELLERMLVAAGYSVVCAPSGRTGLALATELRPDAIVLDVLIPDLDGWSVLAALKSNEALRRIPVVLLTMVDDRRRGYALGAAEYLVKPVSRDKLLEVLERFSGHPTGTALLVEDDRDMRALVARHLASCGWTVREADHGRAALEVLAQGRPDVLLLDLMMPEMDGFELLGRVRADPALADLPVVVLTGMELDRDEYASLGRSVQRILQKGAVGQLELLSELRARLSPPA